jgi:DNA replication protein DnaC
MTSTTNSADTVAVALRNAGVSERHITARLAEYKAGTESQQKALEYVRAWSHSDASTGWVLYGKPGVGKTHLAVGAVAERIAYRVERLDPEKPWDRPAAMHACVVNVAKLLDDLRHGFKTGDRAFEDAFRHLRDACPLLVLDDLGREKVTDWAGERIYVLFESRYSNMLTTIVTSNATPRALSEFGYGAVVSRLAEMGDFIEVHGDDQRVARHVRA